MREEPQESKIGKCNSAVVDTARVRIGLIEIDRDKVPVGAQGFWGTGKDEEKAVTGAQEGAVEGVTRGQRSWWWWSVAVNGRSGDEIWEVDRERCVKQLWKRCVDKRRWDS